MGAVLFFGSLGLYILTMAPGLTWGDSGELVADVYTLGIPHPTGYPLYVLAGRLFMLIPAGSPAYRMNLFSAFCAAAAVLLIYGTALLFVRKDCDLSGGIARKESGEKEGEEKSAKNSPGSPSFPASGRSGKLSASDRKDAIPLEIGPSGTGTAAVEVIAAASAAFVLAVSPLFWSQATMAEVYAPASLLGALLLYSAIRCRRRASVRSLDLFALTLGLVLVHHLLLVLLFPVALYLVLPALRRYAKPAVFGGMVLFFLLGLSPVLYLYIRGRTNPVMNWGGVDSLGDVIRTMTGGTYGGGFANPLPTLFSGDPERLRGLVGYFSPWFEKVYSQFDILILVAALGLISWLSRKAWFALLYLLTLLAAIVIPACYQVADRSDFFYVFPLALTLPLAEGIVFFRRTTPLCGRGWFKAVALVVLVLLVLGVLPRVSGIGRSTDTGAAEYARGVFEIAQDARMIVTGIGANQMARDNEIHTLWYGKYVLRNGQGPVILGANFLGRPWYDERLREKGIPLPDWDGLVAAGEAVRTPDGSVVFTGANVIEARNNWIEALARDVLIPALGEGPVYSTGRIPGPWGGIRFIEAGRVPLEPETANPTQQPLLPSGVVYRLELPAGYRSAPEESPRSP